jgi:hypothetical protein
MLRVLHSQEWEKPYEHLTTDARSRVAHIANRILSYFFALGTEVQARIAT